MYARMHVYILVCMEVGARCHGYTRSRKFLALSDTPLDQSYFDIQPQVLPFTKILGNHLFTAGQIFRWAEIILPFGIRSVICIHEAHNTTNIGDSGLISHNGYAIVLRNYN